MSQTNPPLPSHDDLTPVNKPRRDRRTYGVIAFAMVVIIIVVLISVFGFPKGCSQTNYLSKSNGIGIVSYSLGTSASGSPAITGKADNISGRDLSSVTIVFSLYDTSGTLIDTASDTVQNLKSGQSWSFTCEIKVQDVASFSIKEIIVT
jgi:hypothetical protein